MASYRTNRHMKQYFKITVYSSFLSFFLYYSITFSTNNGIKVFHRITKEYQKLTVDHHMKTERNITVVTVNCALNSIAKTDRINEQNGPNKGKNKILYARPLYYDLHLSGKNTILFLGSLIRIHIGKLNQNRNVLKRLHHNNRQKEYRERR